MNARIGRDGHPQATLRETARESGLSALHIRRAVEASPRRLRSDRIDVYQMHHVDRSTPWDEIRQVMDVLVTRSKIIYVG
ncbi:aldo/keto reductase [Streptomyces sp. NPDC001781]